MKLRLPRTLAGRLTFTAVAVAAATLVVLTATFNVLLERSVDRDIDSRLRAQAAAAVTTVSVERGRVRVGEAPDDAAVDSQIWIYAGQRALERPLAGQRVQSVADRMAGGARRFANVRAPETRLYAIPIAQHGRRYGTVVAGVSLAAYDRTTDNALVGSLIFAALMLAIVGIVTRAVVGSALRPVGQMTAQAAEWSDRDIDHRFGAAQRPEELDQLAGTFDALLDRLAASIRHEQRLSGELSHELRTPLARIVAETEMLLRRPRSVNEHQAGARVVRDSAMQMTRILDTLMAAARAEADLHHGRGDVRAAALRAASNCADEALAEGVAIDVAALAGPIHAGVDADLIERVLGPIVSNACRHAQRTVEIAMTRRDGRVLIDVTDDGPGVAPEDATRIFDPGVRGDGSSGRDGAGLGLSLARRLARAGGGDITAVASGRGGNFRVDLPGG